MRDLRYNIRNFSEPIKIINVTDVVVNGVVGESTEKEFDVYSNVMLNVGTTNNNNNSNTSKDSIKIEILEDENMSIIPEITKVIVRGKKYIVMSSNPFNINAQTIILTANAIK